MTPPMAGQTVFLVDDDPGVRDALSLLLALHGLTVRVFASAEDFLAAIQPDSHGCALVDVRMQGMGGLELQQVLRARQIPIPLIIMTGFANVAAARMAFKSGAVDFLVKPVSESEMFEAIREALAASKAAMTTDAGPGDKARDSLDRLTTREREILVLLSEGLTSRDVGERLNITHRTVETYKARMMEKLCVRKLSDLIRIAATASSRRSLS